MKFFTSIISSMLLLFLTMPAFSHQAMAQQSRITDEQIMGIIMAVDESEIAAANIAKTKKTSIQIKRYANHLSKQHQHNLSMLKKLGQGTGLTPIKSAQSVAMAKDAHKEGVMLSKLNGRAFESAYINAMVKGHAGGLKLINTVLLKEVKNAKLKKFVESFRALVERHLEKGKKIQAKM